MPGDCIGSGVGNTDQLSVKDSGKGDSDFNDSDSDVSGDLGKRNFTTFQPRSGESRPDALVSRSHIGNESHPCAFSLFLHASGLTTVARQGTCCVVPQQGFRPPRDNAYTIGFAPVPVFHGPPGFAHSWKDSGYGTNRPVSRSGAPCFSRTGTLPSYFPQQQRSAAAAEPQSQSPNIVTVATELEVATIF